MTICWEVVSYNAPPTSIVPQTLMGIFSTVSTGAVTFNPQGFIPDVPPTLLIVMQISTGFTWVCWCISVATIAMKPKTVGKEGEAFDQPLAGN